MIFALFAYSRVILGNRREKGKIKKLVEVMRNTDFNNEPESKMKNQRYSQRSSPTDTGASPC